MRRWAIKKRAPSNVFGTSALFPVYNCFSHQGLSLYIRSALINRQVQSAAVKQNSVGAGAGFVRSELGRITRSELSNPLRVPGFSFAH